LIHPGEAIKLTSAELKPKKASISDKLIYFLVSGAPKYGDLKLKKVFPLDSNTEQQQHGWSKVNDIYLEKSGVREFTQLDLDNGNVWYEPYNDFESMLAAGEETSSGMKQRGCRNRTLDELRDEEDEYEYNGVQVGGENCDEQQEIQIGHEGGESTMTLAKYDHCMFEVSQIRWSLGLN
jgi:hypothetical protein